MRLATAEAMLATPTRTLIPTSTPISEPAATLRPTATPIAPTPITASPASASRATNTPIRFTATVPPPQPTARATSKPSVGYASSNPVPSGQSVLWTGKDKTQLRLTLLKFYRGDEAWNRIKAANQFNPAPPVTWEYILAQVRVDFLTAGATKQIIMGEDQFVIITTDEQIYRTFDGVSLVEPEPSILRKMYVGESIDGWIAFPIRNGGTRLLLAYGQTIFHDEMRVWLELR